MMPKWPTWWSWELELSPHLFKRMADRDFNEVDVRRMLSGASGLRPDLFQAAGESKLGTAARPGRSLWNLTLTANLWW